MFAKSERMVTAAREILKAHGYFVDNLWHANDLIFLCETHGIPTLNTVQAQEVFTLANNAFDGETGLSWPQLERALLDYWRQKPPTTESAKPPTIA